MASTGIHKADNSLLEGPGSAGKPTDTMIARVANDYSVHPLKQLKEIFSMRFGAQKLSANEYYDLGIFDPKRSKADKKAFLGQGGINAMNLAINPDTLMETKNFVGNKLVYTAKLEDQGLATTETQAFVTTEFEKEDPFVLQDAESIADFMRNKAKYPLFGKPLGGSLSVGSVRFEALEGDELRLATGQLVTVEKFAEDVLRNFPDGYLLQTALVSHPTLQKVSGTAIGCIRVVTTHDGTKAKPAYAVWKIPGPTAMSDNFWQEGSMLALLDMVDGTIVQCHRGKGLDAELLTDHPVSGEALIGLQIPYWKETLKIACDAHELTSDLGICGYDIAVTADGPVIVECNDQPNHMLYQYPARKGIQCPELQQLWAAAMPSKRFSGAVVM